MFANYWIAKLLEYSGKESISASMHIKMWWRVRYLYKMMLAELWVIVYMHYLCGCRRSHPSVVMCSRPPCCRLSQHDTTTNVSTRIWRLSSRPCDVKCNKHYQWYAVFALHCD